MKTQIEIDEKAYNEMMLDRDSLARKNDELLSALHSVSHDIADAMLWIQSKTETPERRFQGVIDMLSRSRKQRLEAMHNATT